jgi:CDP-glucose 4,6-dehydratase
LDCLNGYLRFIDAIGKDHDLPVALNFGPDPEGMKSVIDLLEVASAAFPELQFENIETLELKETRLLTLNAELAHSNLDWRNQIDFEQAVLMSLVAFGQEWRERLYLEIDNFLDVT